MHNTPAQAIKVQMQSADAPWLAARKLNRLEFGLGRAILPIHPRLTRCTQAITTIATPITSGSSNFSKMISTPLIVRNAIKANDAAPCVAETASNRVD